MSRYIDADALLEILPSIEDEYKFCRKIINEQPTADVVEVVRCKDCKYQDKGENECESWNLCEYSWLHIPIYDEHFCAGGERREDARNGNP